MNERNTSIDETKYTKDVLKSTYDVYVVGVGSGGFCAGVVRAVDVVELALEKYAHPVYVKHQIVHNPNVLNSLE